MTVKRKTLLEDRKQIMRILIVSFMLVGCNIVNLDVSNLLPLVPLDEYQSWHAEVELCLNQTRNFASIEWFIADELFFNGDVMGGVWLSPNKIILRSDQLLFWGVVKYELIHYIRQDAKHNVELDECSKQIEPLRMDETVA